jgi:hypothetical protein
MLLGKPRFELLLTFRCTAPDVDVCCVFEDAFWVSSETKEEKMASAAWMFGSSRLARGAAVDRDRDRRTERPKEPVSLS